MAPRPAAEPDTIEIAGVRLSHPDRLLYPEQGISKRELAGYCEKMAERILPELSDRPLTMVRCPQGRQRKCFFQRHAGPGTPRQLRRVELADVQGEPAYLTADDLPALVALTQVGALELHAWPARAERPDRPDRLILDLDPGPRVDFAAVVAAALELRDLLAGLGLRSFVKTTGGKGLHVVAPVLPDHDWEAHKGAAKAVAERLEAEAPDRYTTDSAKIAREGRIYVDHLRNSRGASAVVPYSPRARAGAPVAMPLAWEELKPGLDPAAFTVRTVPGLVRDRPNPWAAVAALRQGLPQDMSPRPAAAAR
jgi:bifunctional non-homologous end joining protein LigD